MCHNYQLLIRKWPLHFTLSYVQPVLQHYKRRTVGEAALQSPWKIQMIPVRKLLTTNTLSCQQKEMGNLGKPCIVCTVVRQKAYLWTRSLSRY